MSNSFFKQPSIVHFLSIVHASSHPLQPHTVGYMYILVVMHADMWAVHIASHMCHKWHVLDKNIAIHQSLYMTMLFIVIFCSPVQGEDGEDGRDGPPGLPVCTVHGLHMYSTWIVYVQYIMNKDEKTLYNIMLVPIHVQVNLYFFRVILAHLVHLVHRDSLAPLE